jgi:hypothetical protein
MNNMKKIISTEIVYDNNVDSKARYMSRPYMVRTTIIKTVKEYKYFWMSTPKKEILFTINQNAPSSKSSLLASIEAMASIDYNETINNVANEEMFAAETWLYNNYQNLIAEDITSRGYDFDFEASFKNKIKKILKFK